MYIRITFQLINILEGVVACRTRRILLLSSHMINLDFMANVLARVGGAGSLYIALQAIKLKSKVKTNLDWTFK